MRSWCKLGVRTGIHDSRDETRNPLSRHHVFFLLRPFVFTQVLLRMYRTESTRCAQAMRPHTLQHHACDQREQGAAGPVTRSAVALFAPSTKQQLQKSEHRTTLTRVHFDWGRSVGAPWWARGPRAQTPVPFPFTIHTSLKGIPHSAPWWALEEDGML